mmetsp:Transcript_34937/g.100381  ORF Transcript_34937/g.100381 Transcript_34937/m.100381 type:complete len:864 (-) Transcript_34937:1922-4513(-)
MLGANLCVDCASVAFHGDPAHHLVFEGSSLDAGDAGLGFLDRPFHGHEELAYGQLPEDFAGLDVQVVGHGDGSSAGVLLAVGLGADHAKLVRGREPAHLLVQRRLGPNPHRGLEGLLLRALQELQDLVQTKLPHLLRAPDVPAQDHLLFAGGVVGLRFLLQERSALVALQGDPALEVVVEGPRLHPGHAKLLVRLRALQDLERLPELRLAEALALGDLELARDGDWLRHLEVLLQKLEQFSSAEATGLEVAAEQGEVLGLKLLTRQAREVLAKGGLRDALVAGSHDLHEELLQREALVRHLPPERGRGQHPRCADDLRASLAHGGGSDGGLPLRLVGLGVEPGELLLGVEEGALELALGEQGLLLCDAVLGRLHTRAALLHGRCDSLAERDRRSELRLLRLCEREEGLRCLLDGLRRLLHGLHLVGGRLRERRSLLFLASLDVCVPLGLLGLLEVAPLHGPLFLQRLERAQSLADARLQLRQFRSRICQRTLLAGFLELLQLRADQVLHLAGQFHGLGDSLVHLLTEDPEGGNLLGILGALVAFQGHKADLARGHHLALQAHHAVRRVGLRAADRLQGVPNLHLGHGLAALDLEAVGDRNTLDADEAQVEDVPEGVEGDAADGRGVHVPEGLAPPLGGEGDLLMPDCLRQLLQVCCEGLLVDATTGRTRNLSEERFCRQVLSLHVVAQSTGQSIDAVRHQEFLAALLDEGRAHLSALGGGRLALDHLLRGLLDQHPGDVPLLVDVARLPVLCEVDRGLLQACRQLVQRLGERRVALGVPPPCGYRRPGILGGPSRGLELADEGFAFGAGILGGQIGNVVLRERLQGLCSLFDLVLDGGDLLANCLHLGVQFPGFGVLLERRKF